MNLQLEYDSLVVGDITEVLEHQRTWFGTFRPAFTAAHGPLERRIREFIDFSMDFNARAAADQDPDASEFDRFDDLISSGLWRVRDPGGAIVDIKSAPNFINANEISWIAVGPCPKCGSREVGEGFVLGARSLPAYYVPGSTEYGPLRGKAGVPIMDFFRACPACGHLWTFVTPDKLRAFIDEYRVKGN